MTTRSRDIGDLLDEVFTDFLDGKVPRAKTAELGVRVRLDDVDILLDKLASIGDVHDYVDDQETSVPAQEFFLFLDLISSLLILLGEPGCERLRSTPEARSPYVAWVKKYVTDDRFHDELRSSFPEVFAGRD